ncbi:MAG: ABC transporter ATP-binding protein [Planctomycetes bacterium]|nr:ABC transporter ATP-binding protein [Planctomycetota bacterium]
MTAVSTNAGREARGPSRRELWRWFLNVVRPQRALIRQGLFWLLVNAGCRLAQPWLVMHAIDDYLVGGKIGPGFWYVAWTFFGVSVLEMVARYSQQAVIERAGQRALLRLRCQVFAHVQRLPARYFDKSPTGRLVGRITTDVEALQEMFSSGMVTVLGDLVFLVVAVWLMLSLNVPLTGSVMLMVPVLVIVTMFVRTRVRGAYAAMRGRLSELNGFLHEQVSGMPIVQMFGQEQRRQDEFGTINSGVCTAQLRSVRWESVLSAATELLSSFTTALIVFVGGGMAIGGGEGAVTFGVLFAFVDYMQRFFVPLNDLSLKYTVLQNGVVASERILALLDEAVEPASPGPVSYAHGRGRVSFRDVSFGYEPGHDVIHDIDLEIAPGESVAIVGATGSGKSTLFGLLTRLYELDHGSIALDGIDIRELPLEELRHRVSLVAQDPFLFHGTVLDNVLLGAPERSREDALAAAREIGLDEVVAGFARGLDEPVAERGKNLSAGERQLLAFARVLVLEPEVLLLDEATANVDTHTEELLQAAVRRLMAGRTSLIIAHRLSTVRRADRIVVLHEGRVVEQGPHEELLGLRGVYWRLHRLQYGE